MEQIKDDAVFCSQQELQHKYVYIRCYYEQNKQKAEKLVLKGKVSVKFKTLDFYLSILLKYEERIVTRWRLSYRCSKKSSLLY
jgi:hypothetical protein